MANASPAAVLTWSRLSPTTPSLKKTLNNTRRTPPVAPILSVASSSIARLVSISIPSFCRSGCLSPCLKISLMLLTVKTFSDISFRSCCPVSPVVLASIFITCKDRLTIIICDGVTLSSFSSCSFACVKSMIFGNRPLVFPIFPQFSWSPASFLRMTNPK
uniref:Uncharacterized protein n=1 Tax=Opuntia streptacantha TaxID=393608 RepID=A0A7C8ZY01_OPUST